MSSQVTCNNCHFALDPNILRASTVSYCPSCQRPVNSQTVAQHPSAGPPLHTLAQWCLEAYRQRPLLALHSQFCLEKRELLGRGGMGDVHRVIVGFSPLALGSMRLH
jgi:hypothetical protein